MEEYYMDDLTGLIAVILCMSIIILLVVFVYLYKRHKNQNQTQIILKALEKNQGEVPEDLIASLHKPSKTIKERLLSKLVLGISFGVVGLGLLILSIITLDVGVAAVALILLSVSIGFLAYYFIGRRQLRQEIEAEEKNENKAQQ